MDLKQALSPITTFAEKIKSDVETGVERQLLAAGESPQFAKSEARRISSKLPSGPGLVGMLAAMLLPGRRPLIGAATRIGGGAAAAYGAATAMGKPAWEAVQEFVAQQAPAEALFGLGRGIKGQATGRRALKAHEAAVSGREATIASEKERFQKSQALQKAVHGRAEEAQAATYREKVAAHEQAQQQDQATHAAQVASQQAQHAATQTQQIGDLVKQQVPPFEGVPSTPEGLWRMAYGPEWFEVNKRFDTYLTKAIQEGRGREVTIPAKAAKALGLPVKGHVERGPLQTIPEDLVSVDAGLLAGGMKGQSQRHPEAYRAGARAIDEAEIGDPVERGIYRNALSFRLFMDRSQALEGQVFHPDRVLTYLGKLKANQEVMRRRNVKLFTKLEAAKPPAELPPPPARPRPEKPSPIPAFPMIPRPTTLPEIPPSPVTQHEAPLLALPGLAGGALLGHATGIPHMTWAGAIMGEEAGRRLGPRVPIYTGMPRSPIRRPEAIGRTLTGEGLRQVWDYITEGP